MPSPSVKVTLSARWNMAFMRTLPSVPDTVSSDGVRARSEQLQIDIAPLSCFIDQPVVRSTPLSPITACACSDATGPSSACEIDSG